ncbi:MAG: hypothetical protein AAF800_00070 [Planctomycetota bacterium]
MTCVLWGLVTLTAAHPAAAETAAPRPVERDGVLAVEAEAYDRQTLTDVRAWYRVDAATDPASLPRPDGDPPHLEDASGGAYLEILPDTRRTHDDPLVGGENITGPGKLAVLEYDVAFTTPGRYYVWARVFSTGSEDNGMHVGLDDDWPGSGRRMQWCKDKHTWRWEARQRVPDNHCGFPNTIYLDVAAPGPHTVKFSMREDGIEFDKWLMVRDRLPPLHGPSPEADLPRPLADPPAP